jgi:predicted DNA-binding transcriptional regulator AlpA
LVTVCLLCAFPGKLENLFPRPVMSKHTAKQQFAPLVGLSSVKKSEPLARNNSRHEFITVKEFAAAVGLSEKTIRWRMAIWRVRPAHPQGIPHFVKLGKPYRLRADLVEEFTSQEAAR